MATKTYGTRCANLLIALDLPFEAVVRGLMLELGLSSVEATNAAFDAMQREVAA
jgi:hypothetical protein